MSSLRLLLVGPLPPPSGGMANQTRQLAQLLRNEGLDVEVVQNNAPYSPRWVESMWGIRAFFRLLPYLWRLWRASGRADVAHVMANSGTAWYLFAVPAIRIARLHRVPVIVNYRGGLAEEFLKRRSPSVLRSLRRTQRLVVPSRFLQTVFSHYAMYAHIVPNIVNTEVFAPAEKERVGSSSPHIVVSRNLEAIYGIDTAIRAAALLVKMFPGFRMSIAGSGVEKATLEQLVHELQLDDQVAFTGRLEVADMAALYRSADIVLNPSRVDNTPNSILEALATGVPVVSTDVGGVSFLVEHGKTAWLVPPDDPGRMAEGIAHLWNDVSLRTQLRSAGLELARSCSWPQVKQQWLHTYRELMR